MENREDALSYAMQFARDMPPELADRFVAMWVNDLTLDYGERGTKALNVFCRKASIKELSKTKSKSNLLVKKLHPKKIRFEFLFLERIFLF